MIKILYIIDNIKISSGVSTVVMNYCRNLDKKNIQIDFLLMSKYKESFEEELKENGSKIYYLKNKFSIKEYGKLKNEIEEFYKKNQYDIIELHAPTFSFLFLKIAKKCNIPLRIMHTHSTIRSSDFIKNIVSKILNINFKSYVNTFFACSEKSGQYWYGNKICKSNNYKVIKNGINTDNYKFNEDARNKLRKEYQLEDNTVIGFVGRISKDKNLLFFIDVMKQIVEKNKNYKLLIVGNGTELEQLRIESETIKNNVIFLGMRKDVNELLNCMDLLVLPSKREGLPMVAIEAQLTNLQCFLSDTITTEVDIGATKFLKLDKQIWKNEILKFEKKEKSINRDEFDIKRCSKELEKIYQEIINKIIV